MRHSYIAPSTDVVETEINGALLQTASMSMAKYDDTEASTDGEGNYTNDLTRRRFSIWDDEE